MLDHVVRVFRDLDAELARPGSAWRGFNVIAGGDHADGVTHNALIPCANGSYIELVGFRDLVRGKEHRWWRFAEEGGGNADFALLSDDLDAETAALGDLVERGPAPGGRIRPDGVRVDWRTTVLAPPLPFLIQDVTPRELRAPTAAGPHPNGFIGVTGVVVTTPHLAEAESRYARLRERGTVPVTLREGNARRLSWSVAYRELAGGVDRPPDR